MGTMLVVSSVLAACKLLGGWPISWWTVLLPVIGWGALWLLLTLLSVCLYALKGGYDNA